MSRFILISLVLISALTLITCKESKEGFQTALLEKSWTQSYEEKTADEIEIYRPSQSKEFPMSRYRQIINFQENHQCEYLVLSENDGHYMENGTWEFNDVTNSITIFNSDADIIYEIEILELTNSILKVKDKP